MKESNEQRRTSLTGQNLMRESIRVLVDPRHIRRWEGQPRTYFSKESLKELGDSMSKIGQIDDLIIEPLNGDGEHTYQLIAGERRWLAAKESNITEVSAIVINNPLSAKNRHALAFSENFNRESQKIYEVARGIVVQLNHGSSINDVAGMIGRSVAFVNQYALIGRNLNPEMMILLDEPTPRDSQMSVGEALILARFSQEEQEAVFEKVSSSHKSAKRRIRDLKKILKSRSPGSGPRVGRKHSMRDHQRFVRRMIDTMLYDLEDFFERVGDNPEKPFESKNYASIEKDYWNLVRVASDLDLIKSTVRALFPDEYDLTMPEDLSFDDDS